jgi:septum formation protein
MTRLILASASPRRLALLQQIGIAPDAVAPTDIDETPRSKELPRLYAARLARGKAEAARADDAIVLGADTVVAVGRRILPKAESEADARFCLELISGRTHRVYTAICVLGAESRERIAEAHVTFKRLSRDDIETYIASREWSGKAGGYAIQGLAARYVTHISGSYTAIVGLPLYETANLLESFGIVAKA